MGCSIRDKNGATLDLPLGAFWWVTLIASQADAMDRTRRRETFPQTAEAIVASATGLFQGTYYQWGGVTPWGADCSGMVQTVYALHGVKLLRDAWQQATQGVPSRVGSSRSGRQIFFSFPIVKTGTSHTSRCRWEMHGWCISPSGAADMPSSLSTVATITSMALIGRFRFARRILA